MHCELAISSGGARDTSKGVFAAARAELLVHVLGGQKAAVAALNEGSEVLNLLQGGGRQKVKVHLEENVLTLFNCLSVWFNVLISCVLTAKSVVMVATCIVFGAAVRDAAPPDSS